MRLCPLPEVGPRRQDIQQGPPLARRSLPARRPVRCQCSRKPLPMGSGHGRSPPYHPRSEPPAAEPTAELIVVARCAFACIFSALSVSFGRLPMGVEAGSTAAPAWEPGAALSEGGRGWLTRRAFNPGGRSPPSPPPIRAGTPLPAPDQRRNLPALPGTAEPAGDSRRPCGVSGSAGRRRRRR